jgi:NitT/TauT family transport system permease protein
MLIAGLLLIWEIGASQSTPERIPSLVSIGGALYTIAIGGAEYAFVPQVSATIFRLIVSVVLSLLVGVPIGIIMGRTTVAEYSLSVPVLISMSIPAFVWAFLGVLWFGRTEYLVTVMVGVIVLAPIVVFNVWQGTKEIDTNLLEMSDVFKLSTQATWRHVFLPHLTPYIISSTRMIVAVGWKIMLVAEIFGAENGLGFVINEYFLLLRNDMILAWSLPVMSLIFVFDQLLRWIETELFDWKSDLDQYVAA